MKDGAYDISSGLQMTMDTMPFLREFDYVIDGANGTLTIRGNMEELSVFSLIMVAAVRNLPEAEHKQSVFVSLAMHYLKFCVESGYSACQIGDIEALEKYNGRLRQGHVQVHLVHPDERVRSRDDPFHRH